jgi:DNA-binding NarL/FixJ family response regulator
VTSRRARILCVEDDPATLELLVEVLEEEGHEVIAATNGADGVRKFDQMVDLVICDIEMPGGDGFHVIRELRSSRGRQARIPFIFITAHSERDNHLRARQLGCDDFVPKPVDFEVLVETVRHRLRSTTCDAAADVVLTPREVEAMTWVARGKSSTDIAVLMRASERTVNFHVSNVMQKLGVATRLQAAVRCAQLGLIDAG